MFLKRVLIILILYIFVFSIFGNVVNADYEILNEFTLEQTKANLEINYSEYTSYKNIVKDEYKIDSIDISFGGFISKELYDSLINTYDDIKFGIGASKTSVMIKENKNLIDYAHTATFYTCKPKRVDINGNKDGNGDYYLITISITNIKLSQIDSEITAGCFIYVGDDVYLMKEVTYSIRSIVKCYLEKEENNYGEYLEVLKYINSY